MFRALEHEGVAAECLFELIAGGRRMSIEQTSRAFTACAVLAITMRKLRG